MKENVEAAEYFDVLFIFYSSVVWIMELNYLKCFFRRKTFLQLHRNLWRNSLSNLFFVQYQTIFFFFLISGKQIRNKKNSLKLLSKREEWEGHFLKKVLKFILKKPVIFLWEKKKNFLISFSNITVALLQWVLNWSQLDIALVRTLD